MGGWLGAARTPGVDECTETPQQVKKKKKRRGGGKHIIAGGARGRARGLFVYFDVGAWEM